MNNLTDRTTSNGSGRLIDWLGRQRWWLLALAWMGVIFYLSAQSRLVLPIEVWWIGLLFWIGHFTEYAVLASLLWLAFRSTPALSRRAAAIAFVVAALYAFSDEVHQSFVPGRTPDVRDWLVDVAAAAVALWLLARSRR